MDTRTRPSGQPRRFAASGWWDRAKTAEDRFADEMAAIVRHGRGVSAVERGEDFSLIVSRDGSSEPIKMFLGTIFREVHDLHRAARRDRLRRFASAVVHAGSLPSTWAEAAVGVRIAVRTLSFGGQTANLKRGLQRPLAPFLVAMIAIGEERSTSFVAEADVERWGVSEDELWTTAYDNVVADELLTAPSALGPDALDVVGPAGDVSSWLMVPEALEIAGASLAGETIVLAPSREQLVVVGAAAIETLGRALAWALEEYQSSASQLSPKPYVVRDGVVTEWRPDASHPCAIEVGRADRILAAVEYAFQKQTLDEFFVAKGEDIFASSLFVRERADDSIWSFTSWVMDVDSVLPRADYVAVVVGPGEQFMVSWDDALAAAGAALSPVKDTSPPRWRGPGWPSVAVLDRLRALEVDPTTTSAPEPVH